MWNIIETDKWKKTKQNMINADGRERVCIYMYTNSYQPFIFPTKPPSECNLSPHPASR